MTAEMYDRHCVGQIGDIDQVVLEGRVAINGFVQGCLFEYFSAGG